MARNVSPQILLRRKMGEEKIFRCKKVEAKKGYHILIFADMFTTVSQFFSEILVQNTSMKNPSS